MPTRRPLRFLGPAALLVSLLPAACRSPEENRLDADEQVYAIVAARRAQLGETAGFTIDERDHRLRERLLEAEERGEDLVIGPLGLLDCLEIAAENSRDFQGEREDLYLAALDLTLDRWAFGVQETSSVGVGFDDGGSDGQQESFTGGLGLSRLLGSGALILADIGIDLFRALGNGDGLDAVSSASLSVTQPLLRGFGGAVVLEPLTQAERDVLYQAREYERFRRTFAFDVASRMFRIAQQVDTLGNERQNVISLRRLRERNEAFSEAGQLLEIEVDQARQDELRAETRVIQAEAALAGLYDDFKLFLGLPPEADLTIHDGELGDLFGLAVPEMDFSEEAAVDVALRTRLDHLNTRDAVQDSERALAIAEDGLRAGLTLAASATATSDEGRPTDFSGDNTPWSASLQLDLPIDQLPERNVYRAALITHDAVQRSLESSADTIRADLRQTVRDITTSQEEVRIQADGVLLAERRVESARMLLDAGRADTRDLLESQEALIQAQNAAVQAQVDFALAKLTLFRDMELLRVDADGLRVESLTWSIEQES